MKQISPENKFAHCKHCNGVDLYCTVIKHEIEYGYAARVHCGPCKYFVLKEPTRKKVKQHRSG